MNKDQGSDQPRLSEKYFLWESWRGNQREHLWHKPDSEWLKCLFDWEFREVEPGKKWAGYAPEYLNTEEWKIFEREYNAPGASERRAKATLRKRQGDTTGLLGDLEWLQLLARYVQSPWELPCPPPFNPEGWSTSEDAPWGAYPPVEEVAELLGRKIAPLLLQPGRLERMAEHATRNSSRKSKALQCSLVEDTLGIFVHREQRLPTKKELNRECGRWEAARRQGAYQSQGLLSTHLEHGAAVEGGRIYLVPKDYVAITSESNDWAEAFLCPELDWNDLWEDNKGNFGPLLKELGLSGLPRS